MKPVMLYTLPRTRATVLLQSCRRAIVKDETFSEVNLDLADATAVAKAFYKVEDPNTVLKIHGPHIKRSDIIQSWYDKVLDTKIYDVFVVERTDRVNMFLSLFLADRFGYTKQEEIEPFNFAVTNSDMDHMETAIRDYLDCYPTYGQVISLDDYPTEYFDPLLMHNDNQESFKKHSYIDNFDWAVDQIETVLESFSSEWQDKINTLRKTNE